MAKESWTMAIIHNEEGRIKNQINYQEQELGISKILIIRIDRDKR